MPTASAFRSMRTLDQLLSKIKNGNYELFEKDSDKYFTLRVRINRPEVL